MNWIPPVVILFLVVASHIKLRYIETVTTSFGLACKETQCRDLRSSQNAGLLQRQEVLLLFAGSGAFSTAQGDEAAGGYCEFLPLFDTL